MSLLNKVPRMPKCPSALSAQVPKCPSALSVQVLKCLSALIVRVPKCLKCPSALRVPSKFPSALQVPECHKCPSARVPSECSPSV